MDQENEHTKNLFAALEQMVKSRRSLVVALSKPYDRSTTQEMQEKFIATQNTIDAIKRALVDERKNAAKADGLGASSVPGT